MPYIYYDYFGMKNNNLNVKLEYGKKKIRNLYISNL